MRVVYVFDQMQDVRLIEGFARRFQLTLLVPKSMRGKFLTWPAQEGPFETIYTTGGRAFFVASGAYWLLRNRHRYEAVIAQEEVTAALAANLSRIFTRRPVILQLGRTTAEYFRCRRDRGEGGLKYWVGLLTVKVLAAFNQKMSSAIGASSRYIAESVSSRNRLARAIPAYGVDTALFAPGPTRNEARRKLDLPDTAIVLWRSRVAPEKDPETFVQAIARLTEEGRGLAALYVGGEHREFKKVAERFGVSAILRDAVHPQDLALYYAASDVAVQTSLAEGLGLSPLEALACEVPVVVSAVGGLTEVVKDGDTGLVVPAGDVEATARAIAWLLDHPEASGEMAKRGRNVIVSGYTSESAFDSWEALVKEVTTNG